MLEWFRKVGSVVRALLRGDDLLILPKGSVVTVVNNRQVMVDLPSDEPQKISRWERMSRRFAEVKSDVR